MRDRMHIYGKERLSVITVWMVNDEHEKSAKTVPNNTHKFHGFHFSLSFKVDGKAVDPTVLVHYKELDVQL